MIDLDEKTNNLEYKISLTTNHEFSMMDDQI